VIYSQNLEVKISGYLGNFTVTLETPQGNMNIAQVVDSNRENFDLILDLNTPSLSGADTKPLGYYAPEGDETILRKALEALPEQIGEFEKPVFLQYDANICAHNKSEQTGCQRCLEACPTLAITSKGEAIDVDNYLCQGGGVCATVCPTGALKYAYSHVRKIWQIGFVLYCRITAKQVVKNHVFYFTVKKLVLKELNILLTQCPETSFPLKLKK